MKKRDMNKRMSGFIRARAGTTAIEYALIAALLAVAGIVGVSMLGSAVNSEYIHINNAIG